MTVAEKMFTRTETGGGGERTWKCVEPVFASLFHSSSSTVFIVLRPPITIRL